MTEEHYVETDCCGEKFEGEFIAAYTKELPSGATVCKGICRGREVCKVEAGEADGCWDCYCATCARMQYEADDFDR